MCITFKYFHFSFFFFFILSIDRGGGGCLLYFFLKEKSRAGRPFFFSFKRYLLVDESERHGPHFFDEKDGVTRKQDGDEPALKDFGRHDTIWDKVYAAETQSQKEKHEGDLKKEIKKLRGSASRSSRG